MSPSPVFCPYLDCDRKGLADADTISVHAYKSREGRTPTRYRCAACGRTFAARRGTPFYRLHHPEALMPILLTLLAHGCPVPAVVLALGLDERTVRAWLLKAGAHAAVFHDHQLAKAGGVAVEEAHVQADEICVRVRGGRVWLAQAIEVGTRLWLGGVVARRRDGLLVRHLLARVQRAVVTPALLLLVDGFGAYVSAARALFRVPRRTERAGRRWSGRRASCWGRWSRRARARAGASRGGRWSGPRRPSPPGWRRRAAGRSRTRPTSSGSTRRRGSAWPRWCGASAPARRLATVEAGMWLLGCPYNWCEAHAALRLRQVGCERKWRARTPAMAAGLTERVWTLGEVLAYRVPPIPLTAPRAPRRGRPSSKGKVLPLPGRPDGRSGPPERWAA